MLTKKANFAFTDIHPFPIFSDEQSMIRTAASSKVIIEPGSEKSRIIEAEIKKHPNALFFKAKAIEANKPNTNGDYFSEEELLKAYKSFEGVPFFTNHNNQNIENARGKVIFAEWNQEDKACYVLAFIDRDAYPDICRGIEHEYVTGVSMGCSVGYSVCNICGNKAEKTDDYCTHIRNRKGRKFTGTARDITTGKTKDFKDEPVFEYNYELKFIELSAVVDPACPSCHIQGIIPNEDYLKRVANLENGLFMVKTAAMEKKASQEEIQQIDQVLQTLESIAVNLIKNRKQVEMEFASDLVNILSELQTWMDELVGAGYGNLQSSQVPGTVGNEQPTATAPATPAANPSSPAPASPASVKPVSEETPITPSTGTSSKSQLQTPKLPITTPVKPRAASANEIIRMASILNEKINKSGDIIMGKRRTITAKQHEKEKIMEVLSSSWKEKQDFFENIKEMPSIQDNDNRLVISKSGDSFIIVGENKNFPDSKVVWTYEDLSEEDRKMIQASPKDASVKFLEIFSERLEKSKKQKEGEKIMTDINKSAGATTVNPVPDQVQEAQLRQKGLYHSRTEKEQNQVTQAQLDSQRKGEQEVVTQKQLDAVRTQTESDQVQEAQLAALRTDDEKNTVTQDQLKTYRKDAEPDVVTQKQLESTPAPWARAASRDASQFKSASDHMKSVISVLADTSLASGASADEVCKVASSLVDSTKNRVYLASSILETSKDSESIDFAKRIAFWNNKNLKVASTGSKEIAELIVVGLRKIASDTTINPDVLIEAVDVISEGSEGINGVTKKIEEKIAEAASKQMSQTSRKSELRAALKAEVAEKKSDRDAERDEILTAALSSDSKMSREAERQAWESVLNKKAMKDASYMIETSFSETGLKKEDPKFKSGIVSFARGALAGQDLKLAAVTNVTISGDTIQIAVQTDEGEQEVNIPIGDESAPSADETVPEGDMSGEGLESNLTTPAPTTPAPAPTTPAPTMASSKKVVKTAQAPMGGGVPGTPGGVSAPGASEQALPTPPVEGDAIQSLTEGDTDKADASTEDVPTLGEQQMPWTICPECGSTDVDVTNEDGGINGKCNKCSAEYEAMIKKEVEFKIIKPTVSVGKPAGEGAPESPAETPEVPALPVAAQTRIDKGAIVRIAKNKKEFGHVCPACGKQNLKASVDQEGHSEYTCSSCSTDVTKDIMVSASNPANGVLRVRWDVRPNTGCKGCSDEVSKFASKVKVAQLLKTAATNKDSFPMANCLERMARQYGADTVATFGDCKGKPLAECACKELQRLGFSKIKDMTRIATALMQKDPMDECIADQKKKGHSIKEASHICGCLKKKYASELSDNIYAHAFGKDIVDGKETRLTAQDLITLQASLKEEADKVLKAKLAAAEAAQDEDIGTALPPMGEIEIEVEEVKDIKEASSDAKVVEAKGFMCDKCKKPKKNCNCEDNCNKKDNNKPDDDGPDGPKGPKGGDSQECEEKEVSASAMNGQRIRKVNEEVFNMPTKTASTPNKVEHIEQNVEAGVPRKEAYMGEESKADSLINKTPKAPVVPRKDAYMGKEKEADSLISKELKLPDVAKDNSFMGHEKEIQSKMPAINLDIKGTVIASDAKTTKEAKQMKQVDSIEGDVDVPRGNAKMGEESKAEGHINAPNKGPDVPRSEAYMGKEKEADSLINESLKGPDVPIDNAYMGHEKEVQKDMPAINDEMLKVVKQQRDEQLNKITVAREKQALKVASWLVGNGRIANDLEAFEAAVKALSAFEIDKIVTVANTLFPARTVKTASSTSIAKEASADVHAIPAIVMESKGSEDGKDLVKKLAGAFTIGNKEFDHKLTIYGEKN